MADIARLARAAADGAKLGEPAAQKRGRDPRWPYVPVILHNKGGKRARQEQIVGLAYATRDEALARAKATIDRRREALVDHLCQPRYRALREQYGLPREI